MIAIVNVRRRRKWTRWWGDWIFRISKILGLMETTNRLAFEVAPHFGFSDSTTHWVKFKVGTCHGLWRCKESAYEILAIINEEPHNGHFNDVFEWFEHSCERDNKNLLIRQVWNSALKKHLIEKRGFREAEVDSFNVIKYFKNESIIS